MVPGTPLICNERSDFHYERGYCLVNFFCDATRQGKTYLSVYAHAFNSIQQINTGGVFFLHSNS